MSVANLQIWVRGIPPSGTTCHLPHPGKEENQKGKSSKSMGMSASQARLLSITSRLTNNEFRSQTITNSKLRLATESQEASRVYMNALNSQQIMFMNYDDNGTASKVELTPAVLYDYAPLKNQYILRNANNKVMVSNTDAENFEQTSNLHAFLDRYGLVEDIIYSDRNVKTENPDYANWQKEEPKQEEFKKTETRYRDNWVDKPNPAWQTWHDSEPKESDSKYVITPGYHVYDWQYEESDEMIDLYEMFERASGACYRHAQEATDVDYDGDCYVHVLSHMLDLSLDQSGAPNNSQYPKSFDTSIGESVDVIITDITSSFINGGIDKDYNHAVPSFTPYMLPVSDVIRDGYDPKDGTPVQILYASEHPSSDLDIPTAKEWEKLISDYYLPNIDLSATPYDNDTKLKLIISNYQKDASGNISKKTLYRKCADMLYLIKNVKSLVPDDTSTPQKEYDTYYKEVMVPLIKTFQEDMRLSLTGVNIVDKGYDAEPVINEEQYEDDHKKWLEGEPGKTISVNEPVPYEAEVDDTEAYKKAHDDWKRKRPTEYKSTKESYISDVIVNDQPKAQWYTNLWHALNGSDTANVVEWKQLKSSWDNTAEYGYKVKEQDKSIQQISYEIVDSNLFSSAEWLRFALEHGIVSLEQAQYYNPAEDSLKAMELTSTGYKWNNISYTSARDFVQQDNQKAIAMAEVKYKKRITEIENQDTKFDQDLKKLDTEHAALQTEYESIKEVLAKNVERSFKAFS